MSGPGALRAALLDIDGTLVDSNDAHARAWADALREFGFTIPFDQVRPLIGMGSEKIVASLDIDVDLDSAEGRGLVDCRRSIFLGREIYGVVAFPGARDLVQALRDAGLRCVVASSSSSEEREPLLALAGVSDLFDDVVPPDDVEAGKPAPDTVEVALERNGLTADAAVMIGDTPFDIETAHGAGVRCIALRCGGAGESRLAGADAVFDGPRELAATLRRLGPRALTTGAAAAR